MGNGLNNKSTHELIMLYKKGDSIEQINMVKELLIKRAPYNDLDKLLEKYDMFNVDGQIIHKQVKINEFSVNELEGIKGWLVLLGITIVLTTLSFIPDLVSSYLLWSTSSNVSEDIFNALFFVLLGLLFFCSIHVYLTYLFFSMKKSFPKIYIIFSIIEIIIFSVILVSTNMEYSIYFIFYAFITTISWIVYLLKSKRVEATFVY